MNNNNSSGSVFDKNTIIGFILIFAVMFGFSYLNKPSKEQIEAQQRYNDSIAEVRRLQADEQAKALQKEAEARDIEIESNEFANPDSIRQQRLYNVYGDFAAAAEGEEQFVTLENELMIVKLASQGGRIYSVQLKDYTDYINFEEGSDTPIYIFDGEESSFGASFYLYDAKAINTDQFFFEPIRKGSNEVAMRLKTNQGGYLDFIYTIHESDFLIDFKIVPHNMQEVLAPTTQTLSLHWGQKLRQQEKGRSFEERYAYLAYKFTSDDVEKLKESKSEEKTISTKLKWIGYKDQFFSSVLIADNSFDVSKLTSVRYEKGDYLKDLRTVSSVAFNPNNPEGIAFTYFFGPNKYSLLKDYDKNVFEGQDLQLEKLVPMGWSWLRPFNKYIIIPIFDWLTGFGIPLGLAIFLLTLIIKLGLFPLTYKSLISSAKMRVLKPQIDEINQKFPGQDQAMQRQQKTMELYKQVGVSPMAGCWPMLIQMPFLLALFWFFPTAIELRHEGFLWAKDLSTYDSLISWKTEIPLLSSILGNHISIFCLLMSAATIFSQKISMAMTNTGQQQMPGMNMMMYLMPVFMFFFLNSYPAGLNYYYLISTLITLILNFGSRLFINEEKLLAKLEKNKKNLSSKPAKKKSGFMARLEEAQRQQQALMKEQQKKNNKKK